MDAGVQLVCERVEMEDLIGSICVCSSWLVPALALWAVASLYTQCGEKTCSVTEAGYFLALLVISGITIRTVMTDGNCWLVHTASLCIMVVAGVMRRPVGSSSAFAPASLRATEPL